MLLHDPPNIVSVHGLIRISYSYRNWLETKCGFDNVLGPEP